ncbi:hypothetical protein ACHHYP_03006 [Achlya hypogyna]|uniref:Potassium channel domain-containing protein n=1 Tax=Achlya hypogyna TaxID=1202772 RepID=A0A1V9Z4S7_ACHHY|nr:hypothetical protein ACHHYP_03006 [Achlya hypogyna]
MAPAGPQPPAGATTRPKLEARGSARVDGGRLSSVVNLVKRYGKPVIDKVEPRGNFSRFRALESRIGEWRMDAAYRRHNVLMFCTAMLGLVVAIAELQLSWSFNHHVVTTSQVVVDRTLRETIMKSVVSLSTLVLVGQLYKLHSMFAHEKKLVWGPTFQMRYWTTETMLKAAVEFAVLAVHPPPYTGSYVLEVTTFCMFLRFYLFVRVVRDHSTVYRTRKLIVEQHFKSTPAPNFNWWLSTQIIFSHAPDVAILAFCVWSIVVFSLTTHMSEREENPETFTLVNSTWYVYTAFLTLDFEEYIVETAAARVITCVIIIAGIVLNTLVVVAILDNITLDSKGKVALAYVYRTKAHDALRTAAGTYIVTWVRWKQARYRLLTSIEWTQYLLKVTRAMETMRRARYKKKLTDHSLGDPVLDKLQSLDAGVMKIWNKFHVDGLGPISQADVILIDRRHNDAARTRSSWPIHFDDKPPQISTSAPTGLRPTVAASVEQLVEQVVSVQHHQELVQEQNKVMIAALQQLISSS